MLMLSPRVHIRIRTTHATDGPLVEHVTEDFSWISILGRLFFVESRYRLYLNGASVSVVGPYVA